MLKKNVKKMAIGFLCILTVIILLIKLNINSFENVEHYSSNSNIYNVDEDKLPFESI